MPQIIIHHDKAGEFIDFKFAKVKSPNDFNLCLTISVDLLLDKEFQLYGIRFPKDQKTAFFGHIYTDDADEFNSLPAGGLFWDNLKKTQFGIFEEYESYWQWNFIFYNNSERMVEPIIADLYFNEHKVVNRIQMSESRIERRLKHLQNYLT